MVPPYQYGRRSGPPGWVVPVLLVVIAGLVGALVYVIATDEDPQEQVTATTVVTATTTQAATTTQTTLAATTTEPPIDNTKPPEVPADLAGYGTMECPAPRDNDELPLEGCHRGQRVGWVQQTLMLAGYEVSVDFVYGSATVDAVKQFQESVGLVADGAVGPKTWAALGLPDENGQVSAAQLAIGVVAPGTASIDDEPYRVLSSCRYSSNFPDYGSLSADLFVIAPEADDTQRVLVEMLGYEGEGGVALRFLAGPRVNMTGFLATDSLPTSLTSQAVPLELGGAAVVSINAVADDVECPTMTLTRPGVGVFIDYAVGDVCEATDEAGVTTRVVSFGFGSQLKLSIAEAEGVTGSFYDESDRVFAVSGGTLTVDGDDEVVKGALQAEGAGSTNPDTLQLTRTPAADPIRTCAPELVQGD